VREVARISQLGRPLEADGHTLPGATTNHINISKKKSKAKSVALQVRRDSPHSKMKYRRATSRSTPSWLFLSPSKATALVHLTLMQYLLEEPENASDHNCAVVGCYKLVVLTFPSLSVVLRLSSSSFPMRLNLHRAPKNDLRSLDATFLALNTDSPICVSETRLSGKKFRRLTQPVTQFYRNKCRRRPASQTTLTHCRL